MLDLQVEHVPDSGRQLMILDVSPPAIFDQPDAVARGVRPAALLEIGNELITGKLGDLSDLLIEALARLVEGAGNGPGLHDAPQSVWL